MGYYVLTYGCQMNVRDSEVIAGLLEEAGYEPARTLDEAGVIVVNTCCVRESAEQRILGRLGELNRLKQRNPGLLIGVGGCMTQQEGVAANLLRKIPHVDFVFGAQNVRDLPRLLREAETGRRTPDTTECGAMRCRGVEPSRRASGPTAYVNITYGCDNFCSYCIVPYVRGREVSRPADDIIAEVSSAADSGHREIMLLGQNVNSYGKGLKDGINFAGLLRRVDTVQGVDRIRYMTSHPRDFTQELIDTIAGSAHVCEHFHLPAQSGSNMILEAMNRGYTREYYMDLVERVRSSVPGASITTDFIVGFPGETEPQFDFTLDLVRRVRFDMAYTFMYSPRKGTRAASMPGQVPVDERRRRLSALMREINPIALELNRALLGSAQEILVSGTSEKDASVMTGRTRTNKVVLVRSADLKQGDLAIVRITKARTWTLEGELIR